MDAERRKNMASKIVSLILAVLMLCGVLVGCKSQEPEESDTQQTAASVEGDHLEARDYGGQKFTILSREDTDYEFVGELTGALVEQKVFERNKTVEDRFNATIEVITQKGAWENRTEFSSYVQNLIMAGNTDGVNLVSTHQAYLNTMALQGYALNMRKLPNLDLTANWWEPHYYEQASVDGKTYFAVGDINLSLYERLEVVYFNKKLATENGIEDLYATALDGKWTFEKLYNISKEFGGSKEAGQELYAVAMNCHATRALVPAWNIKYTQRNAETGRDDLYLSGNQKLLDGYSRFYTLMMNTVSHNPYSSSTEMATQAPLFNSDQILFWFQMLSATDELKKLEMDSEYGILPYPLWNESQYDNVGYISTTADNHNGVLILSNLAEEHYDFTGMITEALCMYSRSTVVEAYYDTNLKYRTDIDPRVVEVLDIVRDGMTFSFAQAYSTSIDYLYSYYSRAWSNASNNNGVPDKELSVVIAKYETAQKTRLENVYAQYSQLDG